MASSMHSQQQVCSQRGPQRGVAKLAAAHHRLRCSTGPRPQQLSAAASAQTNSLVYTGEANSSLATYQWPTASLPAKQPGLGRSPTKLWTTSMWFEAMVQTVVRQLQGDQAFLLRVSVNPGLSLQLVRLLPEDLAAGWTHIRQRHLASALQQDAAVILVHPVAAGADQPCVVRRVAGEACTGCPHAAGAAAAAATAAAYGGGVTASFAAAVESSTELLHGKFGDCCGDEEEHGDHHHHHHHHQQEQQQQQQWQQWQLLPRLGQQQPEGQTAYYGLVVQTRDAADPLQGCYLLKTVKQNSSSSSSACHCTHYSLTTVCKGPSLQQQYQASWLV